MGLVVALVALAGVAARLAFDSSIDATIRGEAETRVGKTPSYIAVSTTRLPNGLEVRYVVPPDEIVSGGPPKDGIPSIDSPVFVSAEEAESFMNPDDMVIGLYYKGVARAYPHKILVWHEIVNDVVAGDPIAVTYCPLCYTSIAFLRVIDGEPVEFGVSGRLFNSNLVMYDRRTDTLWSQQWGIAILGPLAGTKLKMIQVDVMRWSTWRELHPDTEVLSPETGYSRPYGDDPYAAYLYYTSDDVWFPIKNRDDRLHPKTLVYGIILGPEAKAYHAETLYAERVVNDEFAGRAIVIFSPMEGLVRAYERRLGGSVLEFEWRDGKIVDKQTGSEWNVYGEAVAGPLEGRKLKEIVIFPGFWFSWAAFFPDIPLYGGGGG